MLNQQCYRYTFLYLMYRNPINFVHNFLWLKFPCKDCTCFGRSDINHCADFAFLQWMIQELNTFYLKAMLWVPPNHSLNLYRELIYAFGGACAVKELYDYLSSTYVYTHTCRHTHTCTHQFLFNFSSSQ